jgi:transcriptional regulator GlxA family with amidase domain
METVAVLVRDGLSLFEFGITAEVFGIDRSDAGVPQFDYRVCAEGGPRTLVTKHTAAVSIAATHGLDALVEADLVIVSATLPSRCTEAERAALQHARANGATVVSLCSGAFLLADSGLLDGRYCTTHWMYAERLRQEFPAVNVQDDALYVDDGDIVTAAGTGAAIDTLLHLVRREFGHTVSGTIARRMVVPPHRDGDQKQYLSLAVPPAPTTSLAATLEWVRTDLSRPHTTEAMAAHAHMSPRTFARRFTEELGTTPHRWLTDQRVRAAQELLERTSLPLEAIASRVGYRDADRLRMRLAREVGTTPARYREAFGAAENVGASA